jgi:hypothetical protein
VGAGVRCGPRLGVCDGVLGGWFRRLGSGRGEWAGAQELGGWVWAEAWGYNGVLAVALEAGAGGGLLRGLWG